MQTTERRARFLIMSPMLPIVQRLPSKMPGSLMRKHKHKASDKTCFEHISNQRHISCRIKRVQTCFKHISNPKHISCKMETELNANELILMTIKLKRILLFSGSQLIISFNFMGKVLEAGLVLNTHGFVDHLLQLLHGLLFSGSSQLIISFNLLGKAWTGSWLGLEYAWLRWSSPSWSQW